MIQRAVRAALLDRRLYKQLTFESSATADGVIIVAGIAAIIYLVEAVTAQVPLADWLLGVLQAAILAAASWLIMAFATWLVGSKIFHSTGSMESVIRMHGYAHVPLLALVAVPFVDNATLAQLIGVAATAWFLAALVQATREALDQDTQKAWMSVLLGYAVIFLVSLAFSAPFLAVQGLLSS